MFNTKSISSNSKSSHLGKAIHVSRAYKQIGYDVVAIGPLDLAAGAEFFDSKEITAIPWVSINVFRSDKTALVPPYRSIIKNGIRFAVLGLTDYSSPHHDFSITDGLEELKELLPELRDSHDMVILLTTLPYEKTLLLAEKFPELDTIIGGDGKKANIKGFLHNNTLVTQTARQGTYLGSIKVKWSGRPWTEKPRDILGGLNASLHAVDRQIAGLRYKPNERVNVAERKKRLDQRKKDILERIRVEKSKSTNQSADDGSTFSTVFYRLDGSIPEDSETDRLLKSPAILSKDFENL